MKTSKLIYAVAGAAVLAAPVALNTVAPEGAFVRVAHAQLYDSKMLSEIQKHLGTLGYDPGPADGKMGWKTRQAIRAFQGDNGVDVDGEPDVRLLARLRNSVAVASAKGDVSSDARALAKSIDAKITEAEKRGRAEPSFLAELRKLIAPHITEPVRRVLNEHFVDNNYTTDPVWVVSGGTFEVKDRGLISTVTEGQRSQSGEDIALSVLGQMLGVQAGANTPDPAAIHTAVNIPNAFELTARLRIEDSGTCELGVYAGGNHGAAYSVAISPGEATELLRRQSGRTTTIATASNALQEASKVIYELTFARAADGTMAVSIDNLEQFKVKDDAIRVDFSGVEHINRIGTCTLYRVQVAAK